MAPLDPALAGSLHEGYDDTAADEVCEHLTAALREHGLDAQIICLWEFPDDGFGMHGGSEYHYLVADEVHHISEALWGWLAETPGTPDAPAEPGHPTTWCADRNPEITALADLTTGTGQYNYTTN